MDAMARNLGCSVLDLMRNEYLRSRIDLAEYVKDTIGMPTLHDIMYMIS
jgi:uncharacterized protein